MTAWQELPVTIEDGVLHVGPHKVMDQREQPIMAAFAEAVRYKRDVLEIGYGLGVLSDELHGAGTEMSRRYCPERHVIIESHPTLAKNARKRFAETKRVKVVEGWWQDVVPGIPGCSFDAVLHDWYYARPDDGGEAFAPHAARILRSGGVYVPWSTESYTYNAHELAALLVHFDEVRLVKVPCVPCATHDHPQIVLAVCKKG